MDDDTRASAGHVSQVGKHTGEFALVKHDTCKVKHNTPLVKLHILLFGCHMARSAREPARRTCVTGQMHVNAV
jgi:hypothetical protein